MSDPAAVRTGALRDLYPEIRSVLDSGRPVSIGFQGTSMKPTLLGGRDRVILVLPKGKLRKYDLPLYRRDNGAFVLHRIVSVSKDGTYACCGDHQVQIEKGIRDDQILAVAEQIVRKGRQISVHAVSYRLLVRIWCFFYPVRSLLFRGYAFFLKLFRRK